MAGREPGNEGDGLAADLSHLRAWTVVLCENARGYLLASRKNLRRNHLPSNLHNQGQKFFRSRFLIRSAFRELL